MSEDQKPKPFSVTPEGSMSMVTGPDGALTVSSDKPVQVDLGTIKSVGIENIIDVAEHSISAQVGFVSHLVKFRDGGEIEFAYNSNGQIIKLAGRGVQTTVENGERLMFRKRPPSAQP